MPVRYYPSFAALSKQVAVLDEQIAEAAKEHQSSDDPGKRAIDEFIASTRQERDRIAVSITAVKAHVKAA
jgi:hypothetical protein